SLWLRHSMQRSLRKRTSWKQALLLLAGGTFTAFIVIELSVRVAAHSLFTWGAAEGYCITDPMVGRIIKNAGKGHHPPEGFLMTVGDHGIRLNGDLPPRLERPLTLAVGDSFAFGDGVDDADTWPAILERLTDTRVINAGMIGFGLDQSVLRAEQLVPIYAPDTLVVSFIPHDVLR